MGDRRVLLVLLLILCFAVVSISELQIVKAEPKSIIVVPDDYPTIQEAINNANEKDTIFVKSGTYEEQTLTIYTAISVIGENDDSTKIVLHPPSRPFLGSTLMIYDSPIQINANHVTLSGFTISADGGSISAEGTSIHVNCNYLRISVSVKGNATQIVDNKLEQSSITVEGSNNSISQNTLNEGRITCEGSFNRLTNNIITRKKLSENTGIVLSGVNNLIFNNKVTNNSITLEGDSNYNIIGKNDCSSILISRSYNNTVFGNYVTGILGFVGSYNVFYRNYLQGILLGNQYMGTPDNIFYENNFDFAGGKEILVYTGVYDSLTFDNGTVGNYWSDYSVQYPYAQSSGSGIGDTPYVVYLTESNSSSPYTYGLGDKHNYELTITDRYPLMYPSDISSAQIQLPAWVNTTTPTDFTEDNIPPIVTILELTNITYKTDPQIHFTVNEPVLWMGYSLDKQNNVTTTENTLNFIGLANGQHTLTIYATDTAGNTGASDILYFKVEEPESFPTTYVAAAVIIASIVISAGLIIYFKKRKH
jgi:hypothetical protein